MLLAVLEFELGGLVGESQRGGVIGVDIVDLVGEFGTMVFFPQTRTERLVKRMVQTRNRMRLSQTVDG